VKIRHRTYDLALEVPFAIARGTASVQRICIAEIEHAGLVGYGEASPSAYYGDSLERAVETISAASTVIGDDPFAVRLIAEKLKSGSPGSPSGRAAVDMALYDLMGQAAGLPLFRLLGLAGRPMPVTSFTVGVTDVGVARRRLDLLGGFPVLKVKVGFGEEERLLDLLSTHTAATLRVDANEGWTLEEALAKINSWSRYRIEFFEQPLPKEAKDDYRRLRQASDAVIFADEGAASARDVLAWAGLVDGLNVKLMKCGGIGEALDMIAVARAAGLRLMLGCMVESAVGITAAAHIASLVDYCDLDGNLLVSNDPFLGVRGAGGIIALSDSPGLGVKPLNSLIS
jgi:L-Ala-D/L-Glu epimerase